MWDIRVGTILCKVKAFWTSYEQHLQTKIVPSAEVEADGLMNLIGPSSGSSICDVAKDTKSAETTTINHDMNQFNALKSLSLRLLVNACKKINTSNTNNFPKTLNTNNYIF